MNSGRSVLRLNRLRIGRPGGIAYDQDFHGGVNIIRGQNSSGKSTIADFIFFILGGEYDDWKDAARMCDVVQAEVETPRGKLTLMRQYCGRARTGFRVLWTYGRRCTQLHGRMGEVSYPSAWRKGKLFPGHVSFAANSRSAK